MVRNFDPAALTGLDIANFSNGGQSILDEVKPSYEYTKDNTRTDKVNGLKVTVVFPANRYMKLTVTVADPIDRLSAVLDKTPAGTPVLVEFVNFTARVYRNRDGDKDTSARAVGVKVVVDDMLEIE